MIIIKKRWIIRELMSGQFANISCWVEKKTNKKKWENSAAEYRFF